MRVFRFRCGDAADCERWMRELGSAIAQQATARDVSSGAYSGLVSHASIRVLNILSQDTSTPPPEDRIFHCVSQCMVRSGFAMDSEANGMLEPGTRITALQSRTTEGGAERLRFDKGWVSVVSKSGAKTFLVEVISTHGHHTKSFADDGIRDKFTKSNQEQFFFKFLFIKSRAVFRKFLFIKS